MTIKTNWNSKTMWVSNAIVVIGILQTVQPELQALIPEIPDRVWGIATILLGFAVRIARALTSVGMGERTTKEWP